MSKFIKNSPILLMTIAGLSTLFIGAFLGVSIFFIDAIIKLIDVNTVYSYTQISFGSSIVIFVLSLSLLVYSLLAANK